jgi:hypothetical protein
MLSGFGLLLRPQRTQEQRYDNAHRKLGRSVKSPAPGQVRRVGQQDNDERNRGEMVCAPVEPQDCRRHARAQQAECTTIAPGPTAVASQAPAETPKAVPASSSHEVASMALESD